MLELRIGRFALLLFTCIFLMLLYNDRPSSLDREHKRPTPPPQAPRKDGDPFAYTQTIYEKGVGPLRETLDNQALRRARQAFEGAFQGGV